MVVVLLLLLDLVLVVAFVVCCFAVLLFYQSCSIVFFLVGFGVVVAFEVCLIFVRLNSGSHDCCFVVVVCSFFDGCCLLVYCFVFVVWATTTQKTQQIKHQNPLLYSVFFAVVITDLWPQKGQQPKAIQNVSFYFSCFPKTLLSAERSVWFLRCWQFLVFLVFFVWFRGPILSAGSGTMKRPDRCSNWFLSVWIIDQNCA